MTLQQKLDELNRNADQPGEGNFRRYWTKERIKGVLAVLGKCQDQRNSIYNLMLDLAKATSGRAEDDQELLDLIEGGKK